MTQPIGWENWPVAYILCNQHCELEIRDWMNSQTISDKFYEIHSPRWTTNPGRRGVASSRIFYRVGDSKLLNFIVLKWEATIEPSHNEYKQATHRIDINTTNKFYHEDNYVSWDDIMEEDHRKERGT